MIIGYQGDYYSNSCIATDVLAKQADIIGYTSVPLISSKGVIDSLSNRTIDYRVVAIRNNIGGEVSETCNAIMNENIYTICSATICIHHYLFKRYNTDISQLRYVSSHIQALIQTRHTREISYPSLIENETPDTAIAARWLADGTIEDNNAVICNIESGIGYNLERISDNIEDRESFTDFAIIGLR